MKSHMELIIKIMIRRYGEDVNHKQRVKTDLGDGEAEYSYEVKEPKRGQFKKITPEDETVNRWGRRIEADAIGTFPVGTKVYESDLIELDDGWYEIDKKITHRTGGVDDYIEVFLRRRQ